MAQAGLCARRRSRRDSVGLVDSTQTRNQPWNQTAMELLVVSEDAMHCGASLSNLGRTSGVGLVLKPVACLWHTRNRYASPVYTSVERNYVLSKFPSSMSLDLMWWWKSSVPRKSLHIGHTRSDVCNITYSNSDRFVNGFGRVAGWKAAVIVAKFEAVATKTLARLQRFESAAPSPMSPFTF